MITCVCACVCVFVCVRLRARVCVGVCVCLWARACKFTYALVPVFVVRVAAVSRSWAFAALDFVRYLLAQWGGHRCLASMSFLTFHFSFPSFLDNRWMRYLFIHSFLSSSIYSGKQIILLLSCCWYHFLSNLFDHILSPSLPPLPLPPPPSPPPTRLLLNLSLFLSWFQWWWKRTHLLEPGVTGHRTLRLQAWRQGSPVTGDVDFNPDPCWPLSLCARYIGDEFHKD